MSSWRQPRSLALLAVFITPPIARADPDELSIEVVVRGAAADGSIEFGKPFELDVIRRWPTDKQAEPWRDEALAPVIVEAQSQSRREERGQTVETLTFRAWLFRRGAVVLQPEFGLVVAEGEAPRRATAEMRTILIDSSLPVDDDGRAELPAAPMLQITPVRRTLLRLLALAATAGAVTWLLVAVVRRRQEQTSAPAGPRAALLAQVEDLARMAADTREGQRRDAVAATAILRAAEQLTTEREPDAGDRSSGARDSAYAALEAVKFAGRALSRADRAALIADLRRVAATVPERNAEVGSA